MHAVLRVAKPRPNSISIENGELVRMLLPARGKKVGEIAEISLAAVGDQMRRGAVIINELGEPIPARRIPIRRSLHGKVLWDVAVIDAGPQCDVCFDPDQKTPAHLAMVYKAT